MAKVDIPSKPDLDLRGKKLLGVANGGDNDAVNKLYVDNAISNASGGADELIINGGQVRIADGGVAFTTGIELVTGGSANNDKLITQGYVDNLNTNNVKLTGQSSQTIAGSVDISAGSLDVYDGSQDIFRVSQDSHNVTIYDGNLDINNGNISVSGTVDGVDVSALATTVAGKQDTLPALNEGRVWTVDEDGDIVQETIDIVGIADAESPSSATVGEEEIQNLVINTASAGNDALGRWPTTEAWQNDRFALKGDTGSDVKIEGNVVSDPDFITTTTSGNIDWTVDGSDITGKVIITGAGHVLSSDGNGNDLSVAIDAVGAADGSGNDTTENVIITTQSSGARAAGRWLTTQGWQEENFLEKVTALPALTNPTPTAGDSVYLTTGANPGPYTYEAGTTNNWVATGGGSNGSSVKVNDTDVANPNFEADTATTPTGFEYSPPFQNNSGKVSVQVDTREIANALGINSLKEQVHQIEEELSQPGGYTWVDESIFISVFVTNRVNSSGTTDQATILQPHFVDNSNIFTTYALLTGDDDTGLRNQWNGFNSNAAGIIVGLGPDDTDLVAFQLLSTYYRDSTAAGLAEIRLKMIDPDGAFAGPSRVGTNTNKQQFISWISDNDNPITTADPNPVIHQGISTYYYETDNDFLDTVRHDVGSHITGSALTADERVIVDSLVADPNIVKSVSQGDEGALTFSIENHSTGVVSTLMTAGDPILRSQHSTTGNGGWTGTGAPPFSLTINNGGPLGPVGSFYIQDVNPANALAYVRVAANGDVDDFTQITWDLAEEPLTGLQFQGGVLSPTAGTITINSLAGLNGAPTGLSLANVTSFEGAGVEFTGIASMNGAPINALEKLGYFLGVPGAEANGTVSIGGEDTQVTYTPYTTTQAEAGVAEPYVRYFYPTIRIDNLITGALTTVAGNGLGVWSNKILTTTNTDGNGYINLIG